MSESLTGVMVNTLSPLPEEQDNRRDSTSSRMTACTPPPEEDDDDDDWEKLPKEVTHRIFLACRIIQVGEINLRAQLWKVRFDLFCEWMHAEDSTTDPGNLADWEPTWEPLLRFTNADEFELSNKMYMTFPKAGYVGYRVTVSGHFRMDSDLTSFPFDVQALPILITLGRERFSRKLLFHEVAQFRNAQNHANVIMSQSSDEYRFRPLRTNLLRTTRSEGVDGQVMSQWKLIAPVRRKPFYYIVNHYMVSAVIQLMTLGCFSVPPGYPRVEMLVTIFVVLAAFKMQVSGEIPRVPAMTHLDKYMNCGFIFMFSIYTYACIECWLVSSGGGGRRAGATAAGGERLEIENVIFWCSVASWIFQQICFCILGQYYTKLWPQQLSQMGALDPQALDVMEDDGFSFENGVLVGDLDFKKVAKARGSRLSVELNEKELSMGNTEEWPTGQVQDEEAVKKLLRPSVMQNNLVGRSFSSSKRR